ncbi:hypothetical protein F4815DRAFT_22839 [Daldinia loculata]|nr:hypothetical protein F4815DRAFT_22839 [Daldinia loculata]
MEVRHCLLFCFFFKTLFPTYFLAYELKHHPSWYCLVAQEHRRVSSPTLFLFLFFFSSRVVDPSTGARIHGHPGSRYITPIVICVVVRQTSGIESGLRTGRLL